MADRPRWQVSDDRLTQIVRGPACEAGALATELRDRRESEPRRDAEFAALRRTLHERLDEIQQLRQQVRDMENLWGQASAEPPPPLSVEERNHLFAEQLLALWSAAHETQPDVPPADFAAWSGATKDLLLALGLRWNGVAEQYTLDPEREP